MSVSLLLITHNNIGQELLKTAKTTFGCLPLLVETIAVLPTSSPESLLPKIQRVADRLAKDTELLILTDAFGSTPSNLALALKGANQSFQVIAGLNLPMLIRIMNYPHLSLELLIDKAINGGREGILLCPHDNQPLNH